MGGSFDGIFPIDSGISTPDSEFIDRCQRPGQFFLRATSSMNDFLRPCNCVHPAEEDCEKCVEETALKKVPDSCDEKVPQKQEPEPAEHKKKV